MTQHVEQIKQKLANKNQWMRLAFMLMFAIINYIIQMLSWGIGFFQWVLTVFTGAPNQRLLSFSQALSKYSLQILAFLMYNTEDKPFPMADWPDK